MHFIDWLILIVYFLGTAVVGLLYMRRGGKSMKDFFVSGRDLPWWLAGTSMVATSFSSDTPLFVTGLIRKEGIWRNWVWWSFAIGGMFAVFFMSRLWRRSEVITDVEFTELRYSGKSAAILRGFRGVYLAFYINCITMAWVILAMLKFFEVAFGMGRWEALVISCGITVAYSALSGLWGVVVTDMVQFVVAMIGSLTLAAICVGVNGGFAPLRDAVVSATGGKDAVLRFLPELPSVKTLFSKEFWTPAATSFFVFISIQWWANKNSDGGSVVIQRMLACKTEKDSLLASLWFNIANYSLRTWPWVLVALASIAAFPALKDLPVGVDDESVYVHMFMTLLPTGLLGLMVASFFAAFMSTVSTHINLASAYFVNDIYKRFLVREAEEKHYVLIARVSSVAFMVISGLMALKAKSISSIFEFLLAFSSGVGIVYILRWFWWRVNAWTEVAAMVASSVVSILLYVVPAKIVWMRTLSSQETLLATVAVSFIVSLVVTFLTSPVAEEKLAEFYRRVRPPGFWGPVAAKVDLPPEARPRYGRDLVNWIAGVALIFGSMFGLGKLCLGFWTSGVVYCIVGAVGAVVIWWNISRRQDLAPTTE
ncbi:MAG: sodium:solute symporter family protein [Planctomycetota bacterium]